jgi:Fic family protein
MQEKEFMKRFDYLFLKNVSLPAEFITISGALMELKSHEDWQKKQYPDVFTKLHELAIVQSVKGSNAIEGIVATDERINAIVSHGSSPLNHNEQEIAGYKDALDEIHRNGKNIAFSINEIKRLHGIMLHLTSIPNKGQFKDRDNAIIEKLADGTQRLRWQPTNALDTPKAMDQLCLSYLAASNDYSINPLLLIPCVILDFLCIHPFSDGNGRMSRLLSLLLLYQHGFDIGRYISFEEQINLRKGEYYEALRQSSVGWHENQNDYVPYMKDFMFTLLLCYKELDKRFVIFNTQKASKKQRIEAAVLSSFIPVSKKDLQTLVPDVSVTTIEAVLGEMVRLGKIIKIGEGHSTRYLKK